MKLDEFRKISAWYESSNMDERDSKDNDILTLISHIKTLLDMLDEAKEVIGFYSNEKNWVHITKDQDGSLNSWRRKYIDDEEILLNYKWPCGASGSLRSGGKRARELLKKWKESL